jgi:hypothetical protein
MGVKNKSGWYFAKVGLFSTILLTYLYHSEIKKVDYHVFDKKAKIEENFYSNPPVLDVGWSANDDGNIETYILNVETGKKKGIMYDMMPKNSDMVDAMIKRTREGYIEKGFDFNKLETLVDEMKRLEKAKTIGVYDDLFGK